MAGRGAGSDGKRAGRKAGMPLTAPLVARAPPRSPQAHVPCPPPPLTFRLIGITSDVEVEKVAPIGNSPTYMTLEDMKKVSGGVGRGHRQQPHLPWRT